jgi:hypothetical protein
MTARESLGTRALAIDDDVAGSLTEAAHARLGILDSESGRRSIICNALAGANASKKAAA